MTKTTQSWNHGYHVESSYVYNHWNPIMPSRLRWAALIKGVDAPAKGFRYLDAGCGQGIVLLFAAAAYPDSEFVGIDFLPSHIHHARKLAERCGIRNVKFIEADFIELAKDPTSLGEFDYVISHGVTTWVAPDVKKALFKVIGQVLKPGGLFYNGYNTFPGWLDASPFQHLVMLLGRQMNTSDAYNKAYEMFYEFKEGNGAIFNAYTNIMERLDKLKLFDNDYPLHEYSNKYWQPVYVSQMMDDLEEVKLSFVGTTALIDAYDDFLPEPVLNIVKDIKDIKVKEQIKDIVANEAFREDLYVKGKVLMSVGEHRDTINSVKLTCLPKMFNPIEVKGFSVKRGYKLISGDPKFYGDILDRVRSSDEGVSTVGEIVKVFTQPEYGYDVRTVMLAISFLIYGNWLTFSLDNNQDLLGISTNKEIARSVCEGAPYTSVLLPRFDMAVTVNSTDMLLLNCYYRNLPREVWSSEMVNIVNLNNFTVYEDGEEIYDYNDKLTYFDKKVELFFSEQLEAFKKAGVVR